MWLTTLFFWDMTPPLWVNGSRHTEGTFCLYLQASAGPKWRDITKNYFYMYCEFLGLYRAVKRDVSNLVISIFYWKRLCDVGWRLECLQVNWKWCGMKRLWRVINLLKPTGHVMRQQFNIQQLYALPTLYLCVSYLSENKERLVPLTS